MSADTLPLWQYACGVVGFLAAFLLFCVVLAPLLGRVIDQAVARYEARARQEIADPILAAHRGHSTRLTRGARS